MTYQIWAFTQAGAKTAYLENAFSIGRAKKINQTPGLSFSLPAGDPKAIYLTSAYDIKIYNTIKARWEDLFTLDDCAEHWSSSGSYIDANYSGVISQLVKEDNITYDTTVTPKTPTQIITAILAMQARTPAITVGTIQPTTPFAFRVENAGMLESLFECVQYLGGYIEVDSNRALNWYNAPSGSPIREIRYQKNMKGVSRKTDYTQIINRLYAYGAENPDVSRLLNLTDAGEAHEYVEDTTSQTAYGISRKRKTDGRITHPATLLRWANQVLTQYKNPIYYYTVDAVNLAEHSDFDFDYENLEIGQMIRVVNSDLNNLLVDVSVVGVDTNLSAPENITIELSTNTPDLSDSFADVKSQQSLSQNVAVQIGAGQVTIQGTVTIEGWKSAGKTTINGGEITANTIEITALNFTPVTGGSVIASINASTEGTPPGTLKIAANHIQIDGDCTFTSGYNPTDKTAKVGGTYDSSASGARVRIFPDVNTGIQITDGTNDVFKAIVGGTDVGDIIIGNYSGDVGVKWDKSAGTLTIKGVIYATSGEFSGTLKTSNIYASSTLSVHGNMQSDSYVADTSGWLIKGSGSVEFNDIKIRGNLESTNWSTTLGSQINLTNGTLKLGGSSAPKLSWNGSTLSIEGAIKATSGEFTGTLKTTNIESGSTLTINGTMQSAGFTISPPAGWQIKGDGTAYFASATIRGAVYATSGEFTGTLKVTNIDASSTLTVHGGMQSTTFTVGSAGWQIKGDGSAEFNNVTVRGTLGACTIGSGTTITVYGNLTSSNYVQYQSGLTINANSQFIEVSKLKLQYGGELRFFARSDGSRSGYLAINYDGNALQFIDYLGASHTISMT
jgi:phage minor structural protein